MSTSRIAFALVTVALITAAAGCSGGDEAAPATSRGGTPSSSGAAPSATGSDTGSPAASSTAAADSVELGLGPQDPKSGIEGSDEVGLCGWLSKETLTALAGKAPETEIGYLQTGDEPDRGYVSRDCPVRVAEGVNITAWISQYKDTKSLQTALGYARRKGGQHIPGQTDSSWKNVSGLGDLAWVTTGQSPSSGAWQGLNVVNGTTWRGVTFATKAEKNTVKGQTVTVKTDRLEKLKAAYEQVFGGSAAGWTATLPAHADVDAADPVTGVSGTAQIGYCQWISPDAAASVLGAAPSGGRGILTTDEGLLKERARLCIFRAGKATVTVRRDSAGSAAEAKKLTIGGAGSKAVTAFGDKAASRYFTYSNDGPVSQSFEVLDGRTRTGISYFSKEKDASTKESNARLEVMKAAYEELEKATS